LLLLLGLLAVFVVASEARVWRRWESQLIKDVNSKNAGWTAGVNKYIRSMEHAKRLMGAKKDTHPLPYLPGSERGIWSQASPPASFDSRVNWPGCIGGVMNQAECGACWAFGCTESLSDRFCIHSNSTIHVSLSPLDLVTCDKLSDGCNGGEPSQAWRYTQLSGVVTYDCYPYNATIPTCAPSQQPCLTFVPTPPCKPECVNNQTWATTKHYSDKVYGIKDNIVDIQTEIMTNGPVEAAFSVYEDFLTYKSGVYKHTTGKYVGGHAVKIIGWGTMDSEAYWLVQNSWTSYWGADGYFLILRGVDECGIESDITAGLPKIES